MLQLREENIKTLSEQVFLLSGCESSSAFWNWCERVARQDQGFERARETLEVKLFDVGNVVVYNKQGVNKLSQPHNNWQVSDTMLSLLIWEQEKVPRNSWFSMESNCGLCIVHTCCQMLVLFESSSCVDSCQFVHIVIVEWLLSNICI